MRFVKVLIILCATYGAYHFWQLHQIAKALRAMTNANGFVAIPAPDGQDSNTVYVVAAENCPHEDAQRADRLAAALSGEHIPVQRTHHVGFSSITNVSEAERVAAIMNGELPIVFVHGRARSNPTVEEVTREFGKTSD